MAVSLTHTTVAVGTDAGNGEIRKAQWNENHTLTLDANKLLGRATAGTGAVEEIDCTAAGRALLDDADAAAQRTTLGLVIGTNVQAFDAELAAIAGLTSAADRLPYFTGSGAAGLATFTAFGRNLVDDADASAARTTLAAAGSGAIGSSGLTMATARLLGRTTAATGAVEEISVGASLTLTGGSLSVTGLSIASGKTLTANNSLTLAGTDSTTMTFPSTSATIARTDAGQTFSGLNTFDGGTVTASNPVLSITQAWNNGAVEFQGINANFSGTSSATSNLLRLQRSGSTVFYVRENGYVECNSVGTVGNILTQSQVWGISGFVTRGGYDTFLTGRAAQNWRFGSGDGAAPAAYTISTENGVGTNIAGVNFTFDASQSTGSAVGGDFVFRTTPAGSSGSGANGYVERLRIRGNGSVSVGNAALATNATNGFLYVPTCAGTPTGTPTAITGCAPIVVDTTNNKLYFYSGAAWRDAGP